MHAFRRDAVYALRSWRRRPALIVAALFALGANTVIFSVVSGVMTSRVRVWIPWSP